MRHIGKKVGKGAYLLEGVNMPCDIEELCSLDKDVFVEALTHESRVVVAMLLLQYSRHLGAWCAVNLQVLEEDIDLFSGTSFDTARRIFNAVQRMVSDKMFALHRKLFSRTKVSPTVKLIDLLLTARATVSSKHIQSFEVEGTR